MTTLHSPAATRVESLRTLALVGPSGAGKTQLAEALLQAAGVIPNAGTVEQGNTTSDWDPLEVKHQHSLSTSALHLQHQGCRIHLLDTPGSAEALGHSLPALEAVETAAVVINAAVGLEPMAHRMMTYAAQRQLDRLIIVNKIDAAGVELARLLEQIRAAFGKECLPLNLPEAGGLKVVDCFFNRDGHSDLGSVDTAHRALVEQVVEVDPAFVDRYLNDGDVDASELHAPLEQALREGHLIPVVFVSARTGAGVTELLDVIVKLLPNPSEANPPQFLHGDGEQAVPYATTPDPAAHVLAHVFKIAIDPYVGKLAVARVHQGTLCRDAQLYVEDGRKPFKVAHLYLLHGKQYVEVPQALPGDIVAIPKVPEARFDAVLHGAAEDDHLHLKPLTLPVPVHGLALEARRRGDEQRLWEVLGRLTEEDPCLRVSTGSVTGETVIQGLGERHLKVLIERLQDVHHVEVQTHPPRIAYRETIAATTEYRHRHKKQTGGAGQFGEVALRVEPLPRGAGFEFVDAVKGGVIPGSLMPAVEKGVREAMAQGVISGHPVVDVRVTVFDGKHHSVDSKEVAFVAAGKKAFLAAVRQAQPLVLEPIVEVEITAPTTALGDVTGDLSARRGLVSGTGMSGEGWMVVNGQVPLSELTTYSQRLNSLTGGQGHYSMTLSHYDPVPDTVQRRMMEAHHVLEEDV